MEKELNKVIKDLSKRVLFESKEQLKRQHLKYKLSGDCHPALDFMVDDLLNNNGD